MSIYNKCEALKSDTLTNISLKVKKNKIVATNTKQNKENKFVKLMWSSHMTCINIITIYIYNEATPSNLQRQSFTYIIS